MRNKSILFSFALILTMLGSISMLSAQQKKDVSQTVYDFTVVDQNMKQVPLSNYQGKVLLIVNSASHCGFTPQYTQLQALHTALHEQGLEILDFPCNQFGQQAPESDSDYRAFCQQQYKVSFTQFHKIDVNGANAIPLYIWLKSQKGFTGFDPTHKLSTVLDQMLRKADPDYASKPDIKWNFTKFLIDRKGNVVRRFEPTANEDQVEAAIRECLAQE